MAKGEIPITKNVNVVDSQGNKYEATYPKRAQGLVKKGRARFIDENTICLACPPNDILGDNQSSTSQVLGKQDLVMRTAAPKASSIMSQTSFLATTDKPATS